MILVQASDITSIQRIGLEKTDFQLDIRVHHSSLATCDIVSPIRLLRQDIQPDSADHYVYQSQQHLSSCMILNKIMWDA
jgi:hypothetical protein